MAIRAGVAENTLEIISPDTQCVLVHVYHIPIIQFILQRMQTTPHSSFFSLSTHSTLV